MAWSLRFSPHTGIDDDDFPPPFAHTLGTTDVSAHVRHAATLGFPGVLYPWAVDASPDDLARVQRALDETGLACSAMSVLPADVLRTDIWVDLTRRNQERLTRCAVEAARRAQLLGSPVLGVPLLFTGYAAGQRPPAESVVPVVRVMADVAADHGLDLGFEAAQSNPMTVLRSVPAACDFIDAIDRPNVGLVFDLAEVCHMTDDLVGALRGAYPHVRLVQFSDQPGQVEPGAGTLPLEDVAAELIALGYDGFVDLELAWREPGAAGEAAGLARLRAFDRRVHDRTVS